MKFFRFFLGSAAAFVLLTPYCGVEACGPFFEPETFVRTTRPDDLQGFARGQLGILQTGFDSNELAVAYRYLNGGRLSAEELAVYAAKPEYPNEAIDAPASAVSQEAWNDRLREQKDAQPASEWLKARAQYVSASEIPEQAPAFPRNYNGLIEFDPYAVNCTDGAFANAVQTLKQRAAAWGAQSAWLADWIHGQDAVFSYCVGKAASMPAAAPANAPALLKADRAYQTAAATLYAKQNDEAARLFAAIATDKSSPWQPWGQYLAARATVRKAFSMGKPTDPWSGDLATFDLATMRQAQQMLEAIRTQPGRGPSEAAVKAELNLVRLRTEPEKRVAEICAALAGPGPDANFRQDLADLNFVLVKHLEGKNPPPLLAWIAAWRSGKASDAYAAWKQTHELPWLVAALAKAGPRDSFAEELLAAAAKIKPGAPAYDTAFDARIRLLVGLKRNDEARALLDAALASVHSQKDSSRLNALRNQRMAMARTFSEFLSFAPRTILEQGSEEAGLRNTACEDAAKKSHVKGSCSMNQPLPGFDEDFVSALNRQIPLSLWLEAASTPSIPANLRQDLAVAAWVRSVLLEDAGAAAKVLPLLPAALGVTPDRAQGFPAVLTILRNPGIQPYLEPGVARVASYSTFSEFRNNWWGSVAENTDSEHPGILVTVDPAAFLSPAQLAAGQAEYARLAQAENSAVVLGQRVLDYAKAHPDDKDVPEALALAVRATHYAVGSWKDPKAEGKANTAISKAAFQLLHSRYPETSWAKKTKFYY
jgi:hypothetical protein